MIAEVAQRFGGSALTYDSAALVQRSVALRLADMIVRHARIGASVFEVGCGTGLLTERMVHLLSPSSLTLNDVSPEMLALARARAESAGCTNVAELVADAESVDWPRADVVASASAVQWFTSPLSAVARAAEALPPGGLFAVATYGPQTFRELRGGLPSGYPSADDWEDELRRCGFEILESESFTRVQEFPSRTALLRMVALTGVGTRRAGQSADALRGEWRLTWDVLLLCARKK